MARGVDALSVLHNPTTREMFLNELREIECFLTQRLEEMSIEGEISSPSFTSDIHFIHENGRLYIARSMINI